MSDESEEEFVQKAREIWRSSHPAAPGKQNTPANQLQRVLYHQLPSYEREKMTPQERQARVNDDLKWIAEQEAKQNDAK